MTYSPSEIIFYLLLTGVTGLIIGWLLRKFFAEKKWAMRYQNIEESNHHIQSLLNTSEERSSSLDEIAQTLASKLALKTSDNNTLVKAFSGIQGARNHLKEQLKNVSFKSRKIQALYAELKERNVELGSRLNQTQEDSNKIKALESSLKTINNTNSSLQQELTHSKDTNQEHTTKISSLESASKEYVTLNETLKSKLLSLNKNIANAEATKVESQKKFLEQIKNLETAHTEIQNKYSKLESNYSDLQSQVTSTNQDNKLYKERLEESITQNEILKSKSLNLNKAMADMEKKASSFKISKGKPDEIINLNLELEQSQTRLKDSANKLQLLQSKLDRNISLNTQVTTLTSERDQLTKDLTQKTASATSNKTLISTLKGQIKTSEAKSSQLSDELKKNKQSIQNISTLKTDLNNSEIDKKKLQIDLQKALEKVSSMLKFEQQLANLNEEMNTNKNTLNSEIERHKSYLMKSETRWASEVKSLRDKLDSTRETHQEATEKATEETQTLHTKVSVLTTERNNLSKTSKNADVALKLASEKNSHHISKLEDKVEQLTHDLKLSQTTEAKATSLKKQTSENNITISKDNKKSQQLTAIQGDREGAQGFGTTHSETSINKLITELKNENKQVQELTSKIEILEKEQEEERNNFKAQLRLSGITASKPSKLPKVSSSENKKHKTVSNKNKSMDSNSVKSIDNDKHNKILTSQNSSHSSPKKQKKTNTKSIRYPIEAIEGVGIVYGKRFRNINVNFVDTLLNKGKDSAGRKSLTERTDINKDLILTWVNHADLFRIEGVEGDYAELLEASGVDTVKELRHRNANNLTLKMASINKTKRLAPKAPEETEVTDWIAQAGKLQPMLTYGSTSNTISKNQVTQEKTTSNARRGIQLKDGKKNGDATADDLTKIDGIGKVNEKRLHSLGIRTFAQIAKFTREDEKSYGAKLSNFHGRIAQEEWAKQAKQLHREMYGKNA
ncbi:MAG: DUF4332 domain-containing protein [Thiotrichaceae bacterium]